MGTGFVRDANLPNQGGRANVRLRHKSQGGHAKVAQWYVVRFNVRHRRSGPLFQGRYRAILSGEPEWITEVNRYIHLNPVRMKLRDLGKRRQAEMRRGIEDTPDEALVFERLKQLREYPWSSANSSTSAIRGSEGKPEAEVEGPELFAVFRIGIHPIVQPERSDRQLVLNPRPMA